MRGVRQSNVPPYTGYVFEEISHFVCLLFFSYFSLMVFTSYSLKYSLIIAGLALAYFVYCTGRERHSYFSAKITPTPSHKLAISDVAKFSRHEREEKCWNKYITTNMQSYLNCS